MKSLAFIIPGAIFLIAMLSFGDARVPVHNRYPASDSDSAGSAETGTIPTTKTDRHNDSVFKPIRERFKQQHWTDSLNIYKAPHMRHEEMTGGFASGGYFNIRDSSFEWRDTLCIKMRAVYRGPNNPWYLYAIDTCASCVSLLGDVDETWGNTCDSIRILGHGPQIRIALTSDTDRTNSAATSHAAYRAR